MKNDYLWDRTGTDPEVEHLESMLEGLRFRPTEPPHAPAREIVFVTARRNWLVRLGLGFAAPSAACAAIFLGLSGMVTSPLPVAMTPPETSASVANSTVDSSRPAGFDYTKVTATRPRKPKLKTKKRARRDAKFTPALVEPRPLPETFTAEERDAYRQLMTALAVTGESLNIVREKINGTKED